MAETLRMYDLAPSPNNVKVRIALGYKGIRYERIPVDPQDRKEVVRVSGQPLLPVLAHGDRVVYDSAAILRYLDANFRDTPPLFSSDRETMKEIERWEHWGRGEFAEPVSLVFRMFLGSEKDPGIPERASKLLHDLTARMESRLRESAWLVGDAMSAADVTLAPVAYYGMVPEKAAATSPVAAFFRKSLRLGDGRERTRELVEKVLAYDR